MDVSSLPDLQASCLVLFIRKEKHTQILQTYLSTLSQHPRKPLCVYFQRGPSALVTVGPHVLSVVLFLSSCFNQLPFRSALHSLKDPFDGFSSGQP